MVIPYILAFFAVFKISGGDITHEGVGGFFRAMFIIAGFFGGAAAWWTMLAFVINLFRRRFRPRHMLTINHVAGLIIGILGIYTILSTFLIYSPCDKQNTKIIIAIDGFSSCGKSTFAKAIAARLGYIFIDTGAMYRAVTLHALEHGAIRSGIVDEEAVVKLLGETAITFRFNRTGSQRHPSGTGKRPDDDSLPGGRSAPAPLPGGTEPPGSAAFPV